jgi:hypothetical protein
MNPPTNGTATCAASASGATISAAGYNSEAGQLEACYRQIGTVKRAQKWLSLLKRIFDIRPNGKLQASFVLWRLITSEEALKQVM